jgi:hypothetical protein
MSCNCNSSNCSKVSCGCKDIGLSTPCVYSSCTEGKGETCAETICSDCVIECGDSFEVGTYSTGRMTIANGERMGGIMQKMALYSRDARTAEDAVQYVQSGSTTRSSIEARWAGVPLNATGVKVQYAEAGRGRSTGKNNPTYIVPPGAENLKSNVSSFNITGLKSNTTYRIKVTTVSSNPVDSVTIFGRTKS